MASLVVLRALPFIWARVRKLHEKNKTPNNKGVL
jgi:hypothetical protein